MRARIITIICFTAAIFLLLAGWLIEKFFPRVPTLFNGNPDFFNALPHCHPAAAPYPYNPPSL